MTHNVATAYACVAYRVMEYDGELLNEKQFKVILKMLFGFTMKRKLKKSIIKTSYSVQMTPS
ncbi:hypothetical protein CE91St54_09520 [Hungatella hathewayi]|uniref:Uncharacterized protein n=1 Tax=Hungatella hathewayi TaxID=154046 RepID=A0AA37JC96_9FIRM|nr:hypothetical protein [Hungatella hathewayi]GKG99014.1 hypothetical protein CE91St55_09960 [Hungatella hathewayi]GKH05844.1 hypothetical protein CE91St54_09520 [Hungatella hathewayi]